MTPSEIIAELRILWSSPPDREFFRVLASQIPEARLADGQHLNDATDFMEWLNELGEAAEPKVATPRPSNRERHLDTCHRCGHIHENDGECGVFMGKLAGYCPCKLEVSA